MLVIYNQCIVNISITYFFVNKMSHLRVWNTKEFFCFDDGKVVKAVRYSLVFQTLPSQILGPI